ncbi:MFS transporter [Nonomuraea sp. NPDC050643]|uniref:MFS transporter n=1 Tax=Nonomuraea sp. NPDC050643 TaxID=3155660 RepID=UPI0033DE0504
MRVAPVPPPAGRRGRPAVTMAAVLLGFLVLPMLMSGTTVALPRIGADLRASGAARQWVVIGYFLAAASVMLVAGSLGDLYGRRRVFAAGALLYTAAAAASAAATDILLLDAARTLAGIGAAGVMAAGGAILGATFTGQARSRAYAAMGTTAGVGMAIGPTLSGTLVGALGWRVTFAVFAALGLLIWAGAAFMAESRAADRPRVDLPGAATLIGALALAMFGVNQATEAGWAGAQVLVPLAAGPALLVTFVLIERRSPHPVLDLGLLRDRGFVAWCLASLLIAAGPAGITAFLPTYLQGVNGSTAQGAGLTMLMLTTPVLLMPPVGARLVNRGLPPRILVTVSLLLIAAGNAWLTTMRPGIGAPGLLGPLATIGIGMGLVIGTSDAQAINRVGADRIGMATGLLNTVRAGGATLVTTLFGTALTNLLQARTGGAASAARVAAGDLSGPDRLLLAVQFTEAWRVVLWSVALLCVAATFVIWLLLAAPRRSGPSRRTSPTPAARSGTLGAPRPSTGSHPALNRSDS